MAARKTKRARKRLREKQARAGAAAIPSSHIRRRVKRAAKTAMLGTALGGTLATTLACDPADAPCVGAAEYSFDEDGTSPYDVVWHAEWVKYTDPSLNETKLVIRLQIADMTGKLEYDLNGADTVKNGRLLEAEAAETEIPYLLIEPFDCAKEIYIWVHGECEPQPHEKNINVFLVVLKLVLDDAPAAGKRVTVEDSSHQDMDNASECTPADGGAD